MTPIDMNFSAKSAENALRTLQSAARYTFGSTEFAELTGREAGSDATKAALARLTRAGRIVLAGKRPAVYLIVPPEHEHYGAPPVDWWLDDYLRPAEPHYYMALLSAARHWGSRHYARQTVQVMVGAQRPALTIGKLGLEYIYKRNLAETPVVRANGPVSAFRVSTREATILDLLRHQTIVGGLEAVVRVTKDFIPEFTRADLLAALDSLDQLPTAQRLGFILERLQPRLAATVEAWLKRRRLNQQPLIPGESPAPDWPIMPNRWSIRYTAQQEKLIEEFA